MNAILGYVTLDNLKILGFANLQDQLPYPLSYITLQNLRAVFGYPYNMVLKIIYCVAGFTVISHAASILKSSPKGEGFSPNPRMGQ